MLFNWLGYRMLISFMQDKAGNQLEAALDNSSYDASQLITIKVPSTHLSFYTNSSQFQRTNGQVEVKGIKYRYVKKRFINDSLEFVCIPDHQSTQLQSAKNDFFKQVNDLQQNGHSKKANTRTGYASPDYFFSGGRFNCDDPGFLVSRINASYQSSIAPVFLPTAKRPPQSIA